MNLTDFDSKQLQTLLDIVVAKIVDEDEHKKEWCKAFGRDPLWLDFYDSGMYYDINQRPLRPVNYEHLCLWRVQIKNAIGKVGTQETIGSN